MTPTTQDLLKAALQLPEDERIALAGELLGSVARFDPNPEWLGQELNRGFTDADAGRIELWNPNEMKRRFRERAAERESS